jgi:pilus assembly protein CpaB
MGERRFGLVLVVALLVAGLAGFGVFRFLQQAQEAARVPMGKVVVAAIDLTEGHVIAPTDAKVVDVPLATVPPGAYQSVDSVVGRVTRIPVFVTEALVPGRLAPVGSGAGLEVKITPGKRAMAVRIDDVVGLSGLIQPNSRVDVLVTLRDDGSGAQQRAKLFMSNMRVLSVGSQIERGPDGQALNETTAALEVTPAEAEQLAIATNQGKIQLVLRGYGDPDTVATRGASMSDISVGRSAPAPQPSREVSRRDPPRRAAPPAPAPVVIVQQPAPAPRPRNPDSSVVQVYRGDRVTQQRFEKKDSTKP